MAKYNSVLRITALLLAMAMLMLTAACGKDEKKPAETTKAAVTSEVSEATTAEEETPLSPGTDTDINGDVITDVLDDYFLAYETKDAELYLSAVSATDEMTVEETEVHLDDVIAMFESECGSNIEISYEVVSSRRASVQDLEDTKDIFGYFGLDGEMITDEYFYSMKITIKGDSAETVKDDYFIILKENGKWVVCMNTEVPGIYGE